jgi:hypothetical protein
MFELSKKYPSRDTVPLRASTPVLDPDYLLHGNRLCAGKWRGLTRR